MSREKGEPGKGLIESPLDYRDVPLSAFKKEFSPLPEKYRIPYILEIKNQGIKPHCVGYSSATLKEEKERREQNFINFDGDWIYRECKKIDGMPNIAGTYFRSGLKVLQKIGAMPAGKEEDPSQYRIGGYARIKPITFESLNQAICEYGTVLTGFRGSNEGWSQAFIRPPQRGKMVWGHAVSSIGFNEKHITIQNSWGSARGDNGYFYFDENYLPFEAWVVLVDLPNNWEELLGKDKTKPNHFFRNDLYFGMKNEEVIILQDCLKYKGCFDPAVDSTGYLGRITLEAVKLFQIRYGIRPVAGYVGPITRAKLNELFAY